MARDTSQYRSREYTTREGCKVRQVVGFDLDTRKRIEFVELSTVVRFPVEQTKEKGAL